MTPDGDFLSGYFAWAFRDRALGVIRQGLDRFEQLAAQRGYDPQPVPTTPLSHTLGDSPEPRGVKLQVAVRDLPRGNVDRPGRNAFQRDAYNLSWINLSASDVDRIATESTEPKALPRSILITLSKALKDCVRGQCSDWNDRSRREGTLFSQCIDRDADTLTIRITGTGNFEGGGRSYDCHLHGRAVYDKQARTFSTFSLVASGQRTGRDGANDRASDMGPAPMGVAFRMYE